MDRVDVIVVGAGVVGLAVAERLSGKGMEVVVAERHDGFGREASSRNSEVIHGGLYHPENSLKTRLCVEGRRMLYEFCEHNDVTCRKTGKIVVANTEDELEKIHHVYEQGTKNGAEGLELLSHDRVARLEPHVVAREGLLSPETGIVDTHGLMKCLARRAEDNGTTVAYCCDVVAIERADGGYRVGIRDADGQRMTMGCSVVVNAAGLGADTVASMVGIDIDAAEYRQHPCKGEYFAVSARHKGKLTRLVYPAPTPISLGIHAVIGLDGSLKLGPNAFYVDRIDYDVDESHRQEFIDGGRQYLPFIDSSDLRPDQSGIRAKLQTQADAFRDFVIVEESARQMPGLVNLVGIESPGMTACLAVAKMVARLV